jgi:hypothetical protein
MKASKAPRVPVLENAFELNLPKLMRAVKATGSSRLVLDDGDLRTVAVLAETRLAVFLGGRDWVVDIVPVQCLGDRVRPLLKCPRAHEGNFMSLYYRAGELACRHCHALRYRSTLVPSALGRARLARSKLVEELGGANGVELAARQPYKWRRRHQRLLNRLACLSGIHYAAIREWLDGVKKPSALRNRNH